MKGGKLYKQNRRNQRNNSAITQAEISQLF